MVPAVVIGAFILCIAAAIYTNERRWSELSSAQLVDAEFADDRPEPEKWVQMFHKRHDGRKCPPFQVRVEHDMPIVWCPFCGALTHQVTGVRRGE